MEDRAESVQWKTTALLHREGKGERWRDLCSSMSSGSRKKGGGGSGGTRFGAGAGKNRPQVLKKQGGRQDKTADDNL